MNRKKLLHIIVLVAFVGLAVFSVIPMQRAQSARADWMASLDDATAINALTIPGTHDSGALHSIADAVGKCQTLSIAEQMEMGVRFLDIRLQITDNKLRIVHSIVDQKTYFEDVLSDMICFLRDNPSEFLLVSIKEDASSKNSDKDFTEVLEQMLLSYSEVSTSTALPKTVGEARGKIHVLARYSGATIGLPCYYGWSDDNSFTLDRIYVQDNYVVKDAEEKIADIGNAFTVASASDHDLVINFTSCYFEECFPPLYAGFPAHEIHKWLKSSIPDAEGPLGVILCDFITSDLVTAMVGRNFA